VVEKPPSKTLDDDQVLTLDEIAQIAIDARRAALMDIDAVIRAMKPPEGVKISQDWGAGHVHAQKAILNAILGRLPPEGSKI